MKSFEREEAEGGLIPSTMPHNVNYICEQHNFHCKPQPDLLRVVQLQYLSSVSNLHLLIERRGCHNPYRCVFHGLELKSLCSELAAVSQPALRTL